MRWRIKIREIGCVIVAALLLLEPAVAGEAQRYTVLMSGLKKGELVVTHEAPDMRRTVYSFRDRGRGPDLETVARTDSAGIPVSIDIAGLDYRRFAVAETFSVSGDRAEWESGAGDGSAPAGAYYYPYASNSEDLAALARALLASSNHRLDLLPEGEAAIAKSAVRQVSGPDGDITVSLYFITGLSMQPAAIWLDAEHELFASGGNWIGVIRAGYEESQDALVDAQEQALADAARTKSGEIAQRPRGSLLIRGANLFDSEQRRMRSGVSVLINGDRIVSVAPDSEMNAPAGAEIIDAQGQALLPGLWDMHVHLLGQADGLLTMMAGVTTVRDMGNKIEDLRTLSDQFRTGALIGPHVLKAGLIDGPGEFAGPTKMLVATPDEMRAAVKTYADLGYQMVKLYSSVDPSLIPVAAQEAHAAGMRVGGHPPAGVTASEAVAAGFDEVQHGNFWLLNFMGAEVTARTNTPSRFTDAYENGYKVDPDGAAVKTFVAQIKEEGAAVDPTLVTFETMFTGWKGKLAAWMKPWAARLPSATLRGGRAGGRASTLEELRQYRESYRRMQQLLLRFHEAGVPVLVGTDGSGLLYARELELHVAAGLSPEDVLYNATLGAARVMGLDDEAGAVAEGMRADLILVDGDPVKNISDIRNVKTVIKSGVMHDASALNVAAGLAPRREER